MSNAYHARETRGRFFAIKKRAAEIMSDKDMMSKHLWRTKPCKFGLNCKKMETCCGAHFKCEYRVPVCLYEEFCDKKFCDFYHPHMGTKEEFIEEMKVKFEYETPEDFIEGIEKMQKELDEKKKELEKKKKEIQEKFLSKKEDDKQEKQLFEENTRPLVSAKKIVNTSLDEKVNDPRAFTRMCRHMKEKKPCNFSGCTFAHSLEQLVLPAHIMQSVKSSQDKLQVAERFLKMKFEPFMLRPAWMNNAMLKTMKDEEDFLDIERKLENVNINEINSDPSPSLSIPSEYEGKYGDEKDIEKIENDDKKSIKFVQADYEEFLKKNSFVIKRWGDEDEDEDEDEDNE